MAARSAARRCKAESVAWALLAAMAGSAQAQDAARGRDLYLDAAAVKGQPGAPSCVQCHGLPPDRKLVGASPAQLTGAFASVVAMGPFALLLDARDIADLSAYLAQPEAVDTPLPRVQPSLLQFAAVPGSASPPLTLEVENAGRATLRLDPAQPLQLSGSAAAFRVDTTSCLPGTALAPGARCEVLLRYLAEDLAGEAQLRLRYAGLDAPTVVGLRGAAALQPALTTSAQGLSFAAVAVGASAVASLRLSNGGQSTLRIDRLPIAGPAANDFTPEAGCPSGSELAPGASCTLNIRFAPGGTGLRQATLTIAGNAPAAVLALSGQAAPATAPVAPPATPAPAAPAASNSGGGAAGAWLLGLMLAAGHWRRRNDPLRSGKTRGRH